MTKRIPAARVKIKRAYEEPAAGDGARVLVDRLWPRGVSKDQAELDEWLREIAPSTELRSWFAHDPARWDEFRQRYRAQLREHGDALLRRLRAIARERTLTLVYAAHDERYNNAVVLREVLLGR